MTLRQQLFALAASLALLVFIVDMVRRRRLREEYSWLWILTGAAIFLLSIWFALLEWLTRLVGAVVPASTLFVLGILFLVVTNIYFSMKISSLTTQVKNQAQRLAIVDHYVQTMRQRPGERATQKAAAPGADAECEGAPERDGQEPC
jgi:hypothetical protein